MYVCFSLHRERYLSTLIQNGWYHGACWQLRPCRRMSCQLFCCYQNCCVKHILYKKGRVHMGNIVQQDLLKQLEQLRQDASAALAQSSTSEAIRACYADYLVALNRLANCISPRAP